MSSSPICYRWKWQLSSTPEDLWPFISDTHRLHIVTGLPSETDKTDESLTGSALLFQTPPDKEKSSYNWIKNKCIISHFKFPKGSLLEASVEIYLEKNEQGTVLKQELKLTPNSFFAKIAIPFLLGKNIHTKLSNLYQDIDDVIQGKKEDSFVQNVSLVTSNMQPYIKKAATKLIDKGFKKKSVKALVRTICHDPDQPLETMRPYVYGTTWGLSPKQVFDLFIGATKVSLLKVKWVLTCPKCGKENPSFSSLKEIETSFKCPLCQEEIQPDLRDDLEIVFTPNPSIRSLQPNKKNIQGPTHNPKIVVQFDLNPNETTSEVHYLPKGHYSVYTESSKTDKWKSVTINSENQGVIYIEVSDEEVVVSEELANKPTIKLANRTNIKKKIIFEEISWKGKKISGTLANSSQFYRNNITVGTGGPKQPINVSDISILVTDIDASIELCLSQGDLDFYKFLKEIQKFQETIISQHDGSIIKTMGDTTFAAFENPKECLEAALSIRNEFHIFNATLPDQNQVMMKFAMHRGPCVAINSFNQLDYFGSTIILCNKILRSGKQGCITLSKFACEDPEIKKFLAERKDQIHIQKSNVTIPGLDQGLDVFHVSPIKMDTPSRMGQEIISAE